MSRLSRGCLHCRARRVKCDQGRPSCQRCIQRNEVCTGYRDEGSLVFRSENEKAARTPPVRRRASTQSLSATSATSSKVSNSSRPLGGSGSENDPSDLSASEVVSLKRSNPFPWTKVAPENSLPSAEDQAVSQFFEKYVMYPCNNGSSPGFLEHLPSLFQDVKVEGRLALRWAVRAAAYASFSKDQNSVQLGNKALECYGLALSALADSLTDPHEAPDDYVLMTVVVLDLFEVLYLQDSTTLGSHAEGMAQILRLRGPNQVYGARGWSLFRLSHHRLQKHLLTSRQRPLAESEAWLNSLNEDLPYVQLEKDNLEISKTCERARTLIKTIDNSDLPVQQSLEMVKEMRNLDYLSTTWRNSPDWAYRTIHRSEIGRRGGAKSAPLSQQMFFPEFIQLHRDVWIAYEWNYHRASRIILHEHLLQCLSRMKFDGEESLSSDIHFLTIASVQNVQGLVDEVLSTVPQSLGDVDHEGNMIDSSSRTPKCQGVGGYFLLWPIKISKSTPSATAEQRAAAQAVFERIRECTGMKSALGEASNI